MNEFSRADTFHLRAAQAWLELNEPTEANTELEQITPALHGLPDVLELRWQIQAKAKKWETCLDIGQAIITASGIRSLGWIYRSISLHQLKRTQEAYDQLEPAGLAFLDSWLVRYHLARFACLLGRRDEACEWLSEAFDLGDERKIKLMALDDPDLEPLWTDIQKG